MGRIQAGPRVTLFVTLVLLARSNAFPQASSAKKGGCIFSRLTASRKSGGTESVSSRRLLQEQCSLQLAGTSYTFTACQDYSSSLGSDLKLHYSVTGGSDGANITLRGGIDAAHVAGESDWVGFGFQPDLEMIGGNALIVQTCSTCPTGASINDYYLSDQDTTGVNPPSRLSVSFQSAALVNNRFIAVFELQLSASQATLTNAGAIYAAGPKSSSGALQQHGFYNSETLDLSPGVTQDLGSALAPLSSEAISPVPATAPQAASAAAPNGQASSAPAVAPRSALPGCGLQYSGNNSVLTFTNCQDLTTSATSDSGLKLYWNLASDPRGNGSIMRAALETTRSGQWAGFAFPSTGGQMVPADAVIVRPCTSCSTGAEAHRYFLGGYDSSSVTQDGGSLVLDNIQASSRGGGGVQALFDIHFSQAFNELNIEKNIIASVGPSASGRLQSHPIQNAFSGQVNFASGATAGGESTRILSKKTVAHGSLMIAAWGLLLPFGVVFARFKSWGSIWFQLHRAIQVVGYLAGFAGAVIGWTLGRPHGTELERNHRIVGWTVWALLTLQMLSLFWRPRPEKSKIRTTWASGHWIAGSAAVFLAMANAFIGLKVSSQRHLWFALYAVAFGLILLLWGFGLGYSLRKGKGLPVSQSRQALKGANTPGRSSSDELVGRVGQKSTT